MTTTTTLTRRAALAGAAGAAAAPLLPLAAGAATPAAESDPAVTAAEHWIACVRRCEAYTSPAGADPEADRLAQGLVDAEAAFAAVTATTAAGLAGQFRAMLHIAGYADGLPCDPADPETFTDWLGQTHRNLALRIWRTLNGEAGSSRQAPALRLALGALAALARHAM